MEKLYINELVSIKEHVQFNNDMRYIVDKHLYSYSGIDGEYRVTYNIGINAEIDFSTNWKALPCLTKEQKAKLSKTILNNLVDLQSI